MKLEWNWIILNFSKLNNYKINVINQTNDRNFSHEVVKIKWNFIENLSIVWQVSSIFYSTFHRTQTYVWSATSSVGNLMFRPLCNINKWKIIFLRIVERTLYRIKDIWVKFKDGNLWMKCRIVRGIRTSSIGSLTIRPRWITLLRAGNSMEDGTENIWMKLFISLLTR